VVTTSVGPLVGRSGELDALRALLRRAAAGTGQVAFVEGEAGIGKSRLLEDAITAADGLGFQVFAGAAEELAANRPFGPLIGALELERDAPDPVRRELARLARGDTAPDDGSVLLSAVPDHSYRVVEGILDLVEGLTAGSPVALILDDLQWADHATLLTVLELGRRLTSMPAAVLTAFRPAPRRAELDRLVTALPEATHLSLAPLPSAAVAELVERMVAAPAGPRLLAEVAGGGGNPLFVTELVRALLDEGDLDWSRGSVELAQSELPRTLRLTMLRRLGFLPQSTLELLHVAAVLGTTFSLPDLSAVLGRPTVQLLPDLDEGVRAGILGEVGSRLRFRHDLLREAVYQDLPYPVRVQLHREAARALAASGARAEQVARHFGLAAEPGDVEAVDWLVRAAHEAGPTAPAMAIELLDRAIELGPAGSDDRGLRAERARLMIWSGRIAEGEAEARSLLDEADAGQTAIDVRAGLALALLAQGRLAEALGHLEALTCNPDLPGAQRSHLMAEAALIRLLTGDRDAAVRDARAALEAATIGNDELGCSLSLATLAWVHHDQGALADAFELATDALTHAEKAGPSVVGRYGAHYFLGTVLTTSDRYEDAAQAFMGGRAAAEATGSATMLTIYHVGIAMLDYATGRWDDAVAELEAGIALGVERGTMLGMTWHWSVWAQIAFHRGERARAMDMLDRAEAEILRVGPQFGVDWMMWTRALCMEVDDPARALTLLRSCWDLYDMVGVLQTVQTIGPDLTRLTMEAGDDEGAAAVAARVEEVADRLGTASSRVAALRCRARAARDPEHALAAVAAARVGPRAIDVPLAAEEAAVLVRDAGRRADAVPLLEEALAAFERLGATADVARVVALLPTVGSRRRARAAPRPTHGWGSLTRSERSVVDLVAEGLTNRQIALQLSVSRRTVETHLSHVFGKLGLSSRVELATAAIRQN
jgi:DNA-binding CsgD family transcriptional regulator